MTTTSAELQMHLNPSPMRNFQGRIAHDSSPSLRAAGNKFVLPLSMAFQSVESGFDYDAWLSQGMTMKEG